MEEVAQNPYYRWLLKRNPFVDLSSEGLENVADIHVWMSMDEKIIRSVEEKLKKGENSLFLLVGEFGSGKTERLRLLKSYFSDYPNIYVKIDMTDIIIVSKRMYEAIKELFPKSQIKIPFLQKKRKDEISFERGEFKIEKIVQSMEKIIPQEATLLILLDELENCLLSTKEDSEQFIKLIESLLNSRLKLVIVGACVPAAYTHIKNSNLKNLKNIYTFFLREITKKEAFKIVENRIKISRQEGRLAGDPIYPFSNDGLELIYEYSDHNPRKFIKMLRNILATLALDLKTQIIDKERVSQILKIAPKEPKISGLSAEESKIYQKLKEIFDSQPFSYISASKKLEIPPEIIYPHLEKLHEKGLLKKVKGKYLMI